MSKTINTPYAKGIDEAHLSTEQQATQAATRFPRPHEFARGAAGSQAPAGQGPQAVGSDNSAEATVLTGRAAAGDSSERYPRRYRLRKRHEYLSLQREGRRRTVPHFVVVTRQRETPPSRLGITTSRKVGGAPARNRVRRLVREFFRRHRAAIAAPSDILVIARPGAAGIRYCDVDRELSRALRLDAASL